MRAINVAFTTLLFLALTSNNAYCKSRDGYHKNKVISDRAVTETINEHEKLHLIFMREEEKLARDVYTTLKMKYPDANIFEQISVSNTYHTSKVRDTLEHFDIHDPVAIDDVGGFSGEEFGSHFTEKYQQLTNKGLTSQLGALYVGALIEEFNMKAIKTCPEVMIDRIDSIKTSNDCGLAYSDNRAIDSLYEHLIDGSEKHLRTFVRHIERQIGEGAYKAQEISQEDVDKILGR